MTLPTFYPNNSTLDKADTTTVRGNRVTNCYGAAIIGIHVSNCSAIRGNDNEVHRLNGASVVGILCEKSADAVLCYNTVSRCTYGFYINYVLGEHSIYNATAHNCYMGFYSESHGVYRNIVASLYEDSGFWKSAYGIVCSSIFGVSVDYPTHYGLGSVSSGNVVIGTNTTVDKPLYRDEYNSDLTPDPLSNLVKTGTANPIDSAIDRGGIVSGITDESTVLVDTFYDLLDNTSWDIDNNQAPEVSFIKAFQSRILANSEMANNTVYNDSFLKTAESTTGFAELFPTYARYQNSTKFLRRVRDLWYATQNPAVTSSYQTGIGGYNLLPSFYTKSEDVYDGWIIATSDVDIDNWLLGSEDIKYGIVIDVLGISTISRGTSAECYSNVQSSIADIAPVRWNLHEEVQPTNYYVSTDKWNGFDTYTLYNMEYDEDFGISTTTVPGSGYLISEPISTATWGSTGYVELSVLDRVLSENIDRTVFYRSGDGVTWGSWVELDNPIGEYFSLATSYIQIRIDVVGVLRKVDYQYLGLCLRPYESARIWTELAEDEMSFIEFTPGNVGQEPGAGAAPIVDGMVVFDALSSTSQLWASFIPPDLASKTTKTLRISVSSPSGPGDVYLNVGAVFYTDTSVASWVIKPEVITIPGSSSWAYLDIDYSSDLDGSHTWMVFFITRNAPGSGGLDTLSGDVLFSYALLS